jgi:hypothetical protein
MFQRLVDQVLSDLQGNELLIYLEDTVIYASSHMEHDIKLHKSADRLNKAK